MLTYPHGPIGDERSFGQEWVIFWGKTQIPKGEEFRIAKFEYVLSTVFDGILLKYANNKSINKIFKKEIYTQIKVYCFDSYFQFDSK